MSVRGNGIPVAHLAIKMDVSSGKLLAIFQKLEDGAFATDGEGKVLLWNRSAERLLGYKAAEILGRRCYEVFQGKDLCGRLLCEPECLIAKRTRKGKAVRNFDMETRTRTGRPVWINVSSIPIPGGRRSGGAVVYLFRDVTKHRRVRRLVEQLHATTAPSALAGPSKQAGPVDVHPPESLTAREVEVLRLMCEGHGTAGIAERLCISPATVCNHVQHILRKLGAHSRIEALAIALRPDNGQ